MKTLGRFLLFITMPIWLIPVIGVFMFYIIWKDFNDCLDGRPSDCGGHD